MADEYKIEYCTHCGRQKKPLATTLFCPNDCDRAPEFELVLEDTKPNRPLCPACNSQDIQPFVGFSYNSYHCIDCGKVF